MTNTQDTETQAVQQRNLNGIGCGWNKPMVTPSLLAKHVNKYGSKIVREIQTKRHIFSTAIAIVLLLGCSVTPSPTIALDSSMNQLGKPSSIKRQVDAKQDDCFSKVILSEREACFAFTQKYNCAKGDHRCESYKQMYFLDGKLQSVLKRIEILISKTYKSYLENDPSYINDAISYIKESHQSWQKYRDSHCLLEQYTSGMSREEIDDLAEICRATKTQKRIAELEELIVALESNKEHFND